MPNLPEFNSSGATGPPHLPEKEPIAIVGIGCRFPGGANTPAAFWKLLSNGVDAITEVPPDRWDLRAFYDQDRTKPGKTYARWGGFLDNIDQFDAHFFGIAPREAAHIDPQQRLLLELTWEALEDAGQAPDRLAGTDTGVFIGLINHDYAHLLLNERHLIGPHTSLGRSMSIAANRISYVFDFHGPSMALDTACSSSLVAVHLACQNIWNGDCQLALVGGVNVMLGPEGAIEYAKASMLSPTGRCHSFDARADGFVRAEGAGLVVLKPLSTALAGGDPIYALIRRTATNQDGHTNGIMVPSGPAQEAMLRAVYHQAGIDPARVQYVEAHGTGTPVGDPLEAGALGAVLGQNRPPGNTLLIGSVKSNIGHTEAAAGIVGLIKAALALKHRQIPPNLHFQTPNPKIPFSELQLRVPQTLEPWPDSDPWPRLAGVNSFGFGGSNAHVVLEEAPRRDGAGGKYQVSSVKCQVSGELESDTGKLEYLTPALETPDAYILPLSARSSEALLAVAQAHLNFLADTTSVAGMSLSDICYSAALRRGHHDHRLALVAPSKTQLAEHLAAFLADETRPGMSSGRNVPGQSPRLAFVFSGMGPQWWAMGRQLLEEEPVFRETIEQCDSLLRQHAPWSLLAELMAAEAESRIHEIQIAQPAIFSLQVAVAALWRAWGIEPEAIIGHSVGEVAAAHVAGALTLPDAIRVIFHRSRLLQQQTGQGKMLAVGLPLAQAEQTLSGYEGRVFIAAINSPQAVTLSGQADALEEISRSLTQQQVFCRFLRVDVPFHSPLIEPARTELLESIQGITPHPAFTPLWSTVTGQKIEGSELGADYWWQNYRDPVCFAPAIESLTQEGYDTFLEISPHPVLAISIQECLAKVEKAGAILPSLRRQEPERAMMLGSLGKLYTLGYPVDWSRLYPDGGNFVRLPSYPWQRERYWFESAEARQARLAGVSYSRRAVPGQPVHPLLGSRLPSARPMWEIEFDTETLTYLTDHRLQGAVVYPAAAYVEMALAAAQEIFGARPCQIKGMEFQKALFLPDKVQSSTSLQLILEPGNNHTNSAVSFDIYSQVQRNQPAWVRHAGGKLVGDQNGRIAKPASLAEIRERCRHEITKRECYHQFQELGIQYGPTFQGIERLWLGEGEALGQISVLEALQREAGAYQFHPAVLDACFQVLMHTLPGEARSLYLPIMIDRVRVYERPGPQLWSHARLVAYSQTHIWGEIQLRDDAGNVLVGIEGLHCRALERTAEAVSESIDEFLYEYQWQLQPRPGQSFVHNPADYVASPLHIAQRLQPEAARLSEQLDRPRYYNQIEPRLDVLCTAYILEALQELGWQPHLGQHIVPDALAEAFGLAAQHRGLFGRLLELLAQDGIVRKDGEGWQVSHLPDMKTAAELWKAVWSAPGAPAYLAEMTLLRQCGPQLAGVLRGEVDPLHLIFPEGSLTTVEHLYQDSPAYRFYNRLVRQALATALERWPAERTVRVLEIGGGTGGLTTYVLPQLPAQWTKYVFTDVSKQFTTHAEQKFRDYPFVDYHLLNIEEDPAAQGLALHSFDLILASDVLHATRDLRQTLEHVKKLLAAEGVLVLLEGTRTPHWGILTFGLLKGWWLFADRDLRLSDPWISRRAWQDLLTEAGFSEVAGVADTEEDTGSLHTVFLARGSQLQQSETTPNLGQAGVGRDEKSLLADPPRAEGDSEKPGRWLIFADSGGVAEQLAGLLRARGETPILILPGVAFRQLRQDRFQLRPEQPEDLRQLLEAVRIGQFSCQGVIHLWSLDIAPPEETTLANLEAAQTLGCISVLHLVQALANVDWSNSANPARSPRLWLVTRNAQAVGERVEPVSVAQAPLWGLGRVISNEYPQLHCTLVDLNSSHSHKEIDSLFAELWSNSEENEIALRGETRYVPRLKRTSPVNIGNPQLQIPTPGLLDNLTLQPVPRRAPGPGEVELQVYAAGLNFKDVMVAMGMLPDEAVEGGYTGHALGLECVGRIVTVGAGVTAFKPGDRVMALTPHSFGSYVTVEAGFVVPQPAQFSFEEAATIPTAFFTAYYCLRHLGRLRERERILIHAAAGGVGLAAVQIAQQLGAEIFATAGSPEKREFLRALGLEHVMDSRSLDFADEVMEHTGGKGVDLVLNSLAGEAIAKSLSVLAAYGRFIEIGKQDIYNNTQLGLRPFRNNLAYFAVDIDRLWQERPDEVTPLFREMMRLFAAGSLHPLPHRVFPLSQATHAFRYMAQAKHIGKIIVSNYQLPITNHQLPIQNAQRALRRKSKIVNPKSTYLITGGLGGFGLATAQWLVKQGARHLVLLGRSGASTPAARSGVESMRANGVDVVIAKTDVTQAQQVADVLTNIRRAQPPLRGIIHAAMAVDDGLLQHLNQARFQAVMAPKVSGAWNLHTQTLNDPLDFFILFSSLTSIIGTPGQGNYVAANTFLDALAYYRRALGLPALSINWGAVADVGYVARNPDLEWRLIERFGVKPLPSAQYLKIIEPMLQQETAQVAAGHLDWSQVAKMNMAGISTRFSDFKFSMADPDLKEPNREIAPIPNPQSLEARLSEQVARVLETSASRLDIDQPLTRLGLDSLMAVELGNMIKTDLGVEVSTVKLINGPSIAQLATLVKEQLMESHSLR